jgi:hypothetical protein
VAQSLARAELSGSTRFMTCSEFSEEHYRENVVCIGGPDFNIVTRRFLRDAGARLHFAYVGNRCWLKDRMSDKKWRGEGTKRTITDVGFFARFTNPYNKNAEVIVICGIETYGVLGAARLLSGIANNAGFFNLYELIRKCVRKDPAIDRLCNFYLVSTFSVGTEGGVQLLSAVPQKRNFLRHIKLRKSRHNSPVR